MKKILTLMVMFAMTAGILSAQQTLSYQLVVRDLDNNLVVNQELQVNVKIFSGNSDAPRFSQSVTGKTNLNGMLSLTFAPISTSDQPIAVELGEYQQAQPTADLVVVGEWTSIDWSNAIIRLSYNYNGHDYVVEEPVFAVPYALQAGYLLSTDLIVEYIEQAGVEDWNRIFAALKGNTSFLNAMRDTVVEYVKANYPIAREIAFHYLSQMTAQDVFDAYNTVDGVLTNNQAVNEALNTVIMDYVQNHRTLAFEVARYYAQHATPDGLQKLYDAAMTKEDIIDPIMDSVLLVFLKEFGLDPACLTDNNYTYCELLNAAANMGSMGVCTEIAKVQNSVSDGLYALYENGGVVYTAYVKNYRNDQVVTAYGFKQVNKNNPNQVEYFLPGNYQAITKQFGKFTYTMDNTETCGDTLLVSAFVTLKLDSIPSECPTTTELTSDEMTVVVPSFKISIVQDGNTLNAKFTPQEAQDAFNIKKENIIWTDAQQQVLGTGLSYEIPANANIAYPITATAHLRLCEDSATFGN